MDDKKQTNNEEKKPSKKSKFNILLIIFAILSALFAFITFKNERILAFLCATVQTALYLGALLIRKGTIKVKKIYYYLAIIAALLLIIPFLRFMNFETDKNEEFDWNDIFLIEVLPEPDNDEGRIIINSDESLLIHICDSSLKDYKKYLEECIDKGFTLESDNATDNYSAYNKDGYYLNLMYYDSNSEISIELEAPNEYGIIEWPSSGVATLAPNPPSNKGIIITDSSTEFRAEISNISKENYIDYVDKCMNRGFSNDYNKTDKLFEAYNENGDLLTVSYEGFDIIQISVSLKNNEVTTDVTHEEITIETQKSTQTLVESEKEIDKIKETESNNQYPNPEEVTIDGAPNESEYAKKVKAAIKNICNEKNVYLRYIENEIDGSLYFEISCRNDEYLIKEITNIIKTEYDKIGFEHIVFLTFTDIGKDENSAGRVIMNVDIYSDGTIDIY